MRCSGGSGGGGSGSPKSDIASIPSPVAGPEGWSRGRSRAGTVFAAIAVVILFGGAAWFFYDRSNTSGSEVASDLSAALRTNDQGTYDGARCRSVEPDTWRCTGTLKQGANQGRVAFRVHLGSETIEYRPVP